ncbi:MAG: formimidoylglutamate deiminase [Gammaproteobacteria bacterium]|nr:formimidoylglutamate deiminase [Gammaproteobacteria bacterium]
MERNRLTFEHILTPAGILSRQSVLIDDDGRISALEDAGDRPSDGFFAVPGMPNAHSHSFQRALCGYGEAAQSKGSARDSFWSWREYMYRLAKKITEQDLYVIARQAFGEMLAAGFTSVAEFHYLHHEADGKQSPAMAQAVIAAARDTGIRLLLLPVLYQQGGFAQPPAATQSRFVHHEIEEFCRLLEQLSDTPLGIAPHSLRAVAVEDLSAILDAVDYVLGAHYPIHIHISEQMREVEECIAHHGARPLEVLAKHAELGPRWSLVHGTHFSQDELALASASYCQVVLCPLTEANLADGIFPATDFQRLGGRWAIGSDSNARIDPIEELRLLEYGQRLRDRLRARLANEQSLGATMWQQACDGGAAALDMPVGRIEVGCFADLTVFAQKGALIGPAAEVLADALIIGGGRQEVAAVYVGGELRARDGTPVGESQDQEYAATIARLL